MMKPICIWLTEFLNFFTGAVFFHKDWWELQVGLQKFKCLRYEYIFLLGTIKCHKMRASWKTWWVSLWLPLPGPGRIREERFSFLIYFFSFYFVLSNWLNRRWHSSCCSVIGSWNCLSGDKQWGIHPFRWVEIDSFSVWCRDSRSADGAGPMETRRSKDLHRIGYCTAVSRGIFIMVLAFFG